MTLLNWQWVLILGTGLIFILLTPMARNINTFFKAEDKDGNKPNLIILSSSLIISWIFAKSITNAANLSLEFGIVGGISYAVYYLSFLVAGIVLYKMRTKGNFESIHHFIQSKYGRLAVVLFSILIAIRLFNEVWSNTMVIGSYFGDIGSQSYYIAILLFTALTLLYTLKGGMRSSLLTDLIQMILFGGLLMIILGVILPKTEGGVTALFSTGVWSMSTGLNLFFVALIQIFSYPFHDSVMTDRAFISDPKTTLHSFLWAGLIGFICIVAFSLVGVYAQLNGMSGQAAVEVGKSLGLIMMLIINFIMITSAASTLDSAFSSFSKLWVIDLFHYKNITISKGRIAMTALCIIGTLPILASPEILSATTISGTMVIGLAPVFIFWNKHFPSWCFHVSVGIGIALGICVSLGCYPSQWIFTEGKYNVLLSANLIGSILCFSIFLIGHLYLKWNKN